MKKLYVVLKIMDEDISKDDSYIENEHLKICGIFSTLEKAQKASEGDGFYIKFFNLDFNYNE